MYKKSRERGRDILVKGSPREATIPTKPRFRSVPDVMVLNSRRVTAPLIKYQRFPRGFFWNRCFSGLVYWLF